MTTINLECGVPAPLSHRISYTRAVGRAGTRCNPEFSKGSARRQLQAQHLPSVGAQHAAPHVRTISTLIATLFFLFSSPLHAQTQQT